MATRQEVILKGLTHSPSDYDCQDGELATCLNLINEDGALHPIQQPIIVESSKNITIDQYSSIELVHKVTHNQAIHSHYIIRTSDFQDRERWGWQEQDSADDTITEFLLGDDFHVNSVCAIGNVLCFVGIKTTKYAIWKNGSYLIFGKEDLQFGIEIANTYHQDLTLKVEAGDNFYDYFIVESANLNMYYNTSAIGTRKMFTDLDAIANKKLAELGTEYLKRNVFGVAALRLYDGTYINISNPFVLPSAESNAVSRKINIYENPVNPDAPNGKTITSSVGLNKYTIEIREVGNLQLYEDIVQGVDIFLTNGESFYQIDKSYPLASEDGIQWLFLDDMNARDVHDTIGNMPFYHSIFIPLSEFEHPKVVKRPTQAEENISLADLNRIAFGGTTAITYNNRLHIAGIRKNIDSSLVRQPYGYKNEEYLTAIYEIPTSNGTYYLNGSIGNWQDIIAVPISDVKEMVVYVKRTSGYQKKRFTLYSPSNFGLSFFVQTLTGGIDDIMGGDWYDITESDWNAIKQKADSFAVSNSDDSYQPSLIRVSEAENPLVFPAKNSVQVGSSIVSAMAANTRPISEGQFGDAPLYAFTDEGVWVLMLEEEGTYIARQPANRDVCSNPKGILQIDDAVLFPTERGIMMQRGRESECITDVLDGFPFDFNLIYSHSGKDTYYPLSILELQDFEDGEVAYVRFRKYMKNASMIYDYYDSRIIVFNPSYDYAYVYSLKSNLWGTMVNAFAKRVNSYPESYAINYAGKIVNVYVEKPSDNIPFFFCTRPLTLNQGDNYKTMFTCIIRGYWTCEANKYNGQVLFGSNDMKRWFYIGSSIGNSLRNLVGSPYRYFRVAVIGNMNADESISSISTAFQQRWQNKLR
jgi:hypothetical protein|nr:MAG TPA: hypothetical protein [Bacteriophage sp.]